jgi:predicted transcriptional regulator
MSIHPEYADAILAGIKRVEFRKRRLSPDVCTVVIYATRPTARIVGSFQVLGHDIAPPGELWHRHSTHAGISADGYDAYFAQTAAAVGILIGSVRPLPQPRHLTELPGVVRPPQSFSYLTAAQARHIRSWMPPSRCDNAALPGPGGLPPVLASLFARTADATRAAADLLCRAV